MIICVFLLSIPFVIPCHVFVPFFVPQWWFCKNLKLSSVVTNMEIVHGFHMSRIEGWSDGMAVNHLFLLLGSVLSAPGYCFVRVSYIG
ncbi:hypothetical protein BO82DRAFT_6125 [Aspergillus uvarum CBS 121591]|uniref:Uncharacterized protein n=1 Tax=Aspergillus uvarum CBS 121591 TaxID=1448315 RepID=A0A319CSJ7_9EURO|nr:hypothetical protein BO82DRAFT_6125 [Aspergillus uvarum CBS 121591]PYH87261.1 hypothetical protein BO82DRAFT_6125 [Aspergillus uvarum CBS 121591]